MNNIVIINDHQLFLYGLKLTLGNEGYLVTTCDSPLKALAEIKNINPDLILIDLYMPEIDRMSMLEVLMKNNIASLIDVLSASESYSDVYRAL